MAESSTASEAGNKLLPDIFKEGWKVFEELEETNLPSNSMEFQKKVKYATELFEQSTQLVNEVALFSTNEIIDEVSTESLQFLLLPYMLGKLSMKLNSTNRKDVLEIAEIYYKDFIKRCSDYELCENAEYGITQQNSNGEQGDQNELAQLLQAAKSRNNKIQRYRIKKELENETMKMKEAINLSRAEEETRRNYFLKLLKKSIIDATEELESIEVEKKMVSMRASDIKEKENDKPESRRQVHHQSKPLKPFIITRNTTQKSVFGLGYPSLPVMTVGEFYQQRVDEGIFPDAEKMEKINKAKIIDQAQDPNEKEDKEKAADEVLIENDDPEYLARQRRLDEYKDVVRRGDGNRYNRS